MMVCPLLACCVCKPREPSVFHARVEVHSFNPRGSDFVPVRIAVDRFQLESDTFSRRVSSIVLNVASVDFNDLREVDLMHSCNCQ